MSDTARLFVALTLPATAREELVRWQARALAGREGVRVLAPESLHVTLCFLGSLPAGETAAIAAACRPFSEPGAAGLTVGAPAWLPARRPRVVAVAIDDPAGELDAVQAELAAALSAGGWFEPEQRRFLPHVTAGRVRRGVRATELPAPDPVSLDGGRVVLFRSWLGRGGARYEALN